MKLLLLTIYLAIGVSLGIIALNTAKPEDKGDKYYLAGNFVGSFIWPLAIVISMVIDSRHNKRKA